MAYMEKYNDFSNIIQTDTPESLALRAYNLALNSYSKDDIIRILTENDDEIKPLAIINLKSIDNLKEARLLLSHLVNHDGRIREAASYALIENPSTGVLLDDIESREILLKGISDINPNVVRNVIFFISQNENLKKELAPMVVSKTREVLNKLSEFIRGPYRENAEKSAKNHAKNKLTFNLYWLLTSISALGAFDSINDILTKTSKFLDYTIREKTALILSKMDNPPDELLRELKNDENIYVKNQLL